MRPSIHKKFSLMILALWAGIVFAAFCSQGGDIKVWAKSADYYRRAPTRAQFETYGALCAANGMTAAIEARTSSNVKDPERATLLALAMYESECRPRPNQIGCLGWFQVCPGKSNAQFNNLLKKYKSEVGDWDGLIRNLSENPVFAAKVAHVDVLGYWRHVSPNEVAAFCGYAGFEDSAQFSATKMCNSAINYILLKTWIMGEQTSSETITEISDPHYGDIIFKDSSGKEIARTLNCQDRRTKLAQALAQTARAYHIRDAVQTQENFFQSLEATESMGSIHQDTLDRVYCFKSLSGSFSIAQALMNGLKWLENWIENIVTTTLNALCSYVVSFVASNIDKMLNSICLNISLPDFVLKMGSLSSSKTCDGISLGQALVTSTGAMSASDLMSSFNQSVADSVFPVINSIPSYGGTINMPLLPLRRVFGTDSTGNEIYH